MNDSNSQDCYQFEFETEEKYIEIIEKNLYLHGVISITINGRGNEQIFEPLPGEIPIWKNVHISSLFEGKSDLDHLENKLLQELNLKILPKKKITKITQKDWHNEWQKSCVPIKIGKRLRICPDHSKINHDKYIQVILNPGLAFGTGSHPTTSLCLEWLEATNLNKKNVLDFGCGSGILGISAIKLGARHVTGVDIDPQAIQASKENAKKNEVEDSIHVMHCDEDNERKYDVIVANILAKPLIELSPYFSKKLKDDGLICISGILAHQTDAIKRAYESVVNFSICHQKEDWVMLAGMKLCI